ncbi:hypothetical protein GN244_ATG20159 [Phytophthora infestans]|nr:hypothetical protein GN244_ATG20159 [Phytophthora infestans]KAF4135548.1 hypothetical protein GN958_ATG15242 [Phytophthora infestans]
MSTASPLRKKMRWCRVALVALISLFLPSSDVLSEAKVSTAASRATLISANPVVAATARRRHLRTVNWDNTRGSSFQDIDRRDGINGDFETDTPHANDREERAGNGAVLEKLQSLKAFEKLKSFRPMKSFSRSMTKATKSFREHVTPLLATSAKVDVWRKNKKSVSFVRNALGLDNLEGSALTGATNFRFYDDFVISQIPVWKKNEWTPNQVATELGIYGLQGAALTSNPNFKYYSQFMEQQALLWAKNDLDIDNILVRLELNTVQLKDRPQAENFKFFEEFVAGLMRSWMQKDTPLADVMVKLKLDKLTGNALLSHPNYKYYKNYVKNNLKEWAADLKSYNFATEKLGMKKGLSGNKLKEHPNYVFLEKLGTHANEYREKLWLQRHVTSFDAWNRLGVSRVHPTLRFKSSTFHLYENYVNLVDDTMIQLINKGETKLPNLVNKEASGRELNEKALIWAKKERPEWYVKFSLGLDGLDETALKEATNYKYYQRYLQHTH